MTVEYLDYFREKEEGAENNEELKTFFNNLERVHGFLSAQEDPREGIVEMLEKMGSEYEVKSGSKEKVSEPGDLSILTPKLVFTSYLNQGILLEEQSNGDYKEKSLYEIFLKQYERFPGDRAIIPSELSKNRLKKQFQDVKGQGLERKEPDFEEINDTYVSALKKKLSKHDQNEVFKEFGEKNLSNVLYRVLDPYPLFTSHLTEFLQSLDEVTSKEKLKETEQGKAQRYACKISDLGRLRKAIELYSLENEEIEIPDPEYMVHWAQ